MDALESPRPAPPVLPWYWAYCGAMALLYLACVAGGVLMIVFRESIAAAEPRDSPTLWLVYGLALIAVGAVLAAVYLAAFFLPARRWAWVYHLVLIAFGLTSCCCLPASIPLLIFWIKPETQAHFGR
jgi:hypothetical protein